MRGFGLGGSGGGAGLAAIGAAGAMERGLVVGDAPFGRDVAPGGFERAGVAGFGWAPAGGACGGIVGGCVGGGAGGTP